MSAQDDTPHPIPNVEKVIERVAMALHDEWNGVGLWASKNTNAKDRWRFMARAAIEETGLSTLLEEREQAREYTIQLQRIIESICHGNPLREDSRNLHHHKMAEQFLAASDQSLSALRKAVEEIAVHEPSDPHNGNLNDLIAHEAVKTARSALKEHGHAE